MPRQVLNEERIHPAVREKVAGYRAEVVKEVQAAIAANDIVVVGMRQNPFPRKARKLLDDAGLAHKMWTGWPTFPMVFVKGVLVGGADDLKRLLESGELKR